MDKLKKTVADGTKARLRFPDDELKYPWLSGLLEAYAVIDEGVSIAIKKEEKSRRIRLACKKGCDICCRQPDIPVYPHELTGICWYSTEKTAGPVRDALKKQLISQGKDSHCPFLINGSCSIYSVRPTACRQFNVFGKPCSESEDPYFSRRGDVLMPIRDYTHRAFSVILPFYGIKGEADPLIIEDIIHSNALSLKSEDWTRLLRMMEDFNLERSPE